MSVLVGILVGCIGFDPMAPMERFTFGHYQLYSGVPFAAALVGLFGFTVVLSDITMIGRGSELVDSKVNLALPDLGDMLTRWRAWIIGSLHGTGIGAIPGVGADGATWVAYGTVRNSSKDPSAFGAGVPEGILAPVSANNATTGGTMVPMLTLGIPGDASTAVMLGAMLLHGLQPGVTLMKNSAEVVYAMLAGLLVSTVVMFLISWRAIRFFIFSCSATGPGCSRSSWSSRPLAVLGRQHLLCRLVRDRLRCHRLRAREPALPGGDDRSRPDPRADHRI